MCFVTPLTSFRDRIYSPINGRLQHLGFGELNRAYRSKIWKAGILIGLSLFFNEANIEAQTKSTEKPLHETFGSSLKELDKPRTKEFKPKDTVQADDEVETIKINTTLVVLDLLVLDQQRRPVTGLKKEDFILKQERTKLPLTTFALGNDKQRKRSVILVIDHGYTQRPYVNTSVDAAKVLVDSLGPLDQMAIVSDDVKLVVNFTSDRSELRSALEKLRKKTTKGANEYTALMATLRELVRRDERTVIVFQADGDELRKLKGSDLSLINSTPALFSLDELYSEAEQSRATIYSVISGYRLIGFSPPEQLTQLQKDCAAKLSEFRAGGAPLSFWKWVMSLDMSHPEVYSVIKGPVEVQLAMAGLATRTGGHTEFLEEPSQAEKIYQRILDDSQSRYLIGFQPPDAARLTESRRSVTIEILGHPEYSVVGRRSY